MRPSPHNSLSQPRRTNHAALIDPGRVRVYNLCSERKYDVMKFEGQVATLAFHDHNAPSFGLMMRFCLDAHAWLAAHLDNVVAVV